MIRKCPNCGRKNRIPASHLADTGKCGACKTALPPLATPISIVNAAEFDDITRNVKVPVLVDFWADWCGPCRAVAPEVARTAAETAGRALVLKVDTEKNPDLATRYRVMGIPNFVVMKGGKVVRQQAGAVDHRQLEAWLEAA